MYLTENKKFIDLLKGFLKSTDKDPENTFRFMMKQMYVQDLMNYTRAHSNGKIVHAGYGNYNSNIVILLDSMDKNESDFFRKVIPSLEIPLHDIYFTPYTKIDKGDIKLLKTVAELELKAISPKCILSVGDHNLKIDGTNIITINKKTFTTMLELLSKEDISEEEKGVLKKLKGEIWAQIKEIKTYY